MWHRKTWEWGYMYGEFTLRETTSFLPAGLREGNTVMWWSWSSLRVAYGLYTHTHTRKGHLTSRSQYATHTGRVDIMQHVHVYMYIYMYVLHRYTALYTVVAYSEAYSSWNSSPSTPGCFTMWYSSGTNVFGRVPLPLLLLALSLSCSSDFKS